MNEEIKIADAHNASIGAAHASEPLPTGDIVDALRERDDPLSQWAADVITHLRNQRAAHASELEFIQCPSCGWHPVRKHASEQK